MAQRILPPTLHLEDLRGEVIGLDRQVPLLDGSLVAGTYLDNAATTPAFRGVQQAVGEFLGWYGSVHRGAGFKSLISTHAYEQAREIVARFVGADPAGDCVIFGKNATEGLNKLAMLMPLRPGDVVLTTAMEHHSNDLPWRARAHVEHVGLCPDGSLDLDDLAGKLRLFDGRVKVVTVTGASNVSGLMPPIHDIAELAHRHGAWIVADCAQLAPHRAVDMGPAGSPQHLDFVVLSGHKMYAPFGAGALVGPKAFFEQGAPDYRGGGTVEVVTLSEVHWAGAPDRDEAGTPNVAGAVALAASMRILSQVGMDALAAHEMEITRYALRRLQELPQVRVYGPADPDRLAGRLGVISFSVEGMPHGKVAAILGFEGGISVRNGCFCAHPYVVRLLGVGEAEFDAFRRRALQHDRSTLPGLVRASFGCYNTAEDVDRLIEMLRRIVAGQYHGDYVVDEASGMYLPRGFDPARLGEWFTI